jgi:DNA repair protein RadC
MMHFFLDRPGHDEDELATGPEAVRRRAAQTGARAFSREELLQLANCSGVAQASNVAAADLLEIANHHGLLLKSAGGYRLA